MTSFGAYDKGLPCKNPNCKSYGKPHPNCHCYGNFAGGGEVKSFCSTARAHKPECEYYKDGGGVESSSPDLQSLSAHGIPSDGMPPDEDELSKSMAGTGDPNEGVGMRLFHSGIGVAMTTGLDDVAKHEEKAKKGSAALKKHIQSLLGDGAKDLATHAESKDVKKVQEWAKTGLYPNIMNELHKNALPTVQNLAHGGEVLSPKAIAKQKPGLVTEDGGLGLKHPEQNVILNAARGRMSNYLTSLRPQENQPKLAFDDPPNQDAQQKVFDRATHMAINPLSILGLVQKGTLENEHIKHFDSMFSESKPILQRELTRRITDMQIKGEKPSGHIRRGLSMLLGTPMSSEFKPANILAAQSVFQAQAQASQNQPEQGKPAKNSKSSLTKLGESLQTSSGSLVARQQRQKS